MIAYSETSTSKEYEMKNLAITCVTAAISAILVTIICKILGVGDASMIVGGGVGGAVGSLTGSKIKQGEKHDDT